MNYDGYPTDLGYTFGYYPVLSPSFLQLITLSRCVPFPSRKPLRYLELGYGHGVSLNIHAAASPGEYWGTDVNQSHAVFAKQLADVSGAGVHALSLSFADLLNHSELPDFDVIVAHGIWSWVSDANRQAILQLVNRRLVEGGIFYVCYNALPGSAQIIPLQRLIRLPSEREDRGATSLDRLEAGIALARALRDIGSEFFASTPIAAERLEAIKTSNPVYLCHEYLGENWTAFSFAETARKLSEAGLKFVGSANLLDHYDELIFDSKGLALLASIEDGWIREAVGDFLRNRQFRSDVYIKGDAKLARDERDEILQDLAFARLVPEEDTPAVVQTPWGQVEVYKPPFGSVLAALAEGGYPFKTVRELESQCSDHFGGQQIVRALLALVELDIVQPVQDRSSIDLAAPKCQKLNEGILNASRLGQKPRTLASPVTGLGIPFSREQQLFLLALRAGASSPDQWAKFAWEILETETVPKDAIHIDGALRGATLLREAFVFQKWLPILVGLGL
jgi:SAM-dependent methyltransferase